MILLLRQMLQKDAVQFRLLHMIDHSLHTSLYHVMGLDWLFMIPICIYVTLLVLQQCDKRKL